MCLAAPHDNDNGQSQQATSGPELIRGRTVLVLLLSVLCGIGAGALWCLAGHPWPEAVVTGGAATGGALGLFHQLVGPRR
ncbi:hypothetical protein [Streptomyces plumbiresistens]|uniref:Uncharacterized protein n=1 Tax=Streptomyces plumbiresistens TaxID=511811 RepID=A0ABP7TJI8_9ACTN